MTPTLRTFIGPAMALAVLAGLGGLALLGVRAIWQELVAIKPELAVAVIAAGATLLGTTVTVMLGRYFERKKDIEAHFRAEKIKIYDEFLAELFKLLHSGGRDSDNMVAFLREWQRKLVLWGGSNVLAAYFKWMNRLKSAPDAQTMFLMDEFFRALRADVGQNSTGLPKGAFANLILRRGDFFLEQATKNPNITLDELSRLEKQRFGDEA
ncbi:MAG: hypothetical protein IT348_19330 [Candidatus Eisenbacteria bacterium]|nr:hypothetical protein [Candidatus Eisenbacteria bacterium]